MKDPSREALRRAGIFGSELIESLGTKIHPVDCGKKLEAAAKALGRT